MTRALGVLSRASTGLATGVYSVVDDGEMTGAVIIHRILSSAFLDMDTMVFWVAIGTFYTDSSSYSIACPVPSPVSLLVRLVIAEVSWSSLDLRHL